MYLQQYYPANICINLKFLNLLFKLSGFICTASKVRNILENKKISNNFKKVINANFNMRSSPRLDRYLLNENWLLSS